MDFRSIDIPIFVDELNAQRQAIGKSYQAVADDCGVSQATIIRTLKHEVSPTMELLQNIAASVHYEQQPEKSILLDGTQEAYIAYLQQQLRIQRKEFESRVLETRVHFNGLLVHERRNNKILSAILALMVAAFIAWLIIDVTHPTVGWFQRDLAYQGSGLLGNLFSGSSETLL